VFAGLAEVLSGLSSADQERIYSGTARQFYRIDEARLGTGEARKQV
jgi:predicted TIM-barrel fold metal-dependent hydrolase